MDYPRPYGSYTLLERLGQGGMSEVDLARREVREGSYVRFVVIKRVAAKNATDDSFLTMFKDEARINAQLHHQNIAQVYDFGIEGDEFFLVMEYVPGLDLRAVQKSLARRGKMLPTRVSLTILAEVLSGLEFAHTFVDPEGRHLKIVHRDVNPRNVMVGLTGEVKLIDFGVAKADGRLESTQGHSLKGKFAYMAPEQIEGQRGLDHRADLFAVGLMMQELLTGVHPFFGLKEVQIMHRVLSGKVGALEPLPEGLDATLLKRIHSRALEVDPERRYPSAQAFRSDLERAVEPLGGLCSRQELVSFLKRVEPDLTNNLSSRMQTWRTGETPAAPSAPSELVPNREQSLTLANQQSESRSQVTRTVVAAGIGGGVVAGAVVVVLLLGGSAWWFSQRGPESPPPRREPINALPSPEAEQAPVEAATPDRVPAPVPPTQEAAPETLPETVPTEPELPEEEAEESVEPDVAEPEPSAADTGPLWANRVLTSPWAPEEARGPEETPPEAGSTPDPELEPVAVEMGYLAVTSQTKGLEVIVDGKVLARTPDMLVQVPLGYQMVTVRDPMTGNTDTKSITVSKTQQNLLTFDL